VRRMPQLYMRNERLPAILVDRVPLHASNAPLESYHDLLRL
jgi:hypothetical protein